MIGSSTALTLLYLLKDSWIDFTPATILRSSIPCPIFDWGKDAAVRLKNYTTPYASFDHSHVVIASLRQNDSIHSHKACIAEKTVSLTA